MKRYLAVLVPLAATVLLHGCSSSRPAESVPALPAFTLDQLLSRMPARDSIEARWVLSSMMQTGQAGLLEVCRRLGQPGTERNVQAEYALQGLAAYVVRQSSDVDRTTFVSALCKTLESPLPVEQASFLIERLQVAGRGESMVSLSRFLADERLCEPAVRALVAIRDGAEAPLLAALPAAGGNCRITIIKSLGDLRSRNAVGPLLEEAKNESRGIRLAALRALANIGDSKAEQILTQASLKSTAAEKDECTWNTILFARRQVEGGNIAPALNTIREVYERRSSTPENHFRAAALEIMVQANGVAALDDLIGAMSDSSKQLRIAALSLGSRIQGGAATGRWVAAARGANPEVRSEIMAMLGQRGDGTAFVAVVEAVNDADSTVRASAVEAAVRLKGAEALPSCMALLRRSREASDVAAVARALDRLTPAQVVSPVIEALFHVTEPAAVMLADRLGRYGAAVPVEPILALCKSKNSSVRIAAIRALGTIATKKDQPRLIDVLFRTEDDAERSAAQKSLASVCLRISDAEKRADTILETYRLASTEQRRILLRSLSRIGGKKAFALILEDARSKEADTRDAAVRSLADWPTLEAYDSLLSIAKSKEKLNLRVLALRGCVRVVENAPINPPTAVRYHERTLAAAERVDEKRLVLGALGNLRSREALRIVIPFIGDDSLGLDAAMAAGKICAGKAEKKDELGSSEVARAFIESEVPVRFRSQVSRSFDANAGMNQPPRGFVALFNGKDLKGWKGLVANPVQRANMDPAALSAAQVLADSSMRAHWSVADGVLVFDGKGESLCTEKDYGDVELLVDWKIERNGDSGIYLRGSPQVQIWDPAQWPEGSGGLYNNQKGPSKPLLLADNPIGEWNTFRIRMIGERVTVYLNDVLVVDSVALENYWDRNIAIFPTGQIELQSHNSPLFFRNVFVREIPRQKPLFSGSLFNGRDLSGWKIIGGKDENWGVKDGILFTMGEGGGWLSTDREYDNFQLDLDFRVSEGGNSGVFLRSPRQGDPAYTGMEVQVLDDYASVYARLKQWQYCGSLYGVQAPLLRVTKNAGEWQHYTIVADGPRVKVTLNNQLIVDADLISHMDKESIHPGLKRRSGYIGLQCHGTKVEYRNITIKELEWKGSNERD